MAEELKDETVQSENEPERTFTQDELNAIVSDRLAQERKKYADYGDLKAKAEKYDADQEAQKTELQKMTEQAEKYRLQVEAMTKQEEIRTTRDKVAAETGVPANLLTAETEEACNEQAKAILAWKKSEKPAGYPNVKDNGEVQKISGGKTRDQFADWFNEALSKK